jgi:hypothetical protein
LRPISAFPKEVSIFTPCWGIASNCATTGLLLGVWLAAFEVRHRAGRMAFQSAVVDDFPPLKLHFTEIAKVQTEQWFRI